MQGEKSTQEDLFYYGSLDSLVPQDDPFRLLDRVLDLSWLRQATRDLYSSTGRPSVDPVVIAKLLLIAYFEDIGSERKLMRQVQVNLSYRRFIHYGLSQALPDHSALTRSRQRLGEATVRRLFEYVLSLCLDAGLIGGKLTAVDSTFVQANASLKSLRPRLVEAEAKQAAARLMRVLDEGDEARESDDSPPGGKQAPKRNQRLVSRTDPDSGIYSRSSLKARLGYLVQFAVDCTKQIVIGVITTGAQQRDVTQILPLLDQVAGQGMPLQAVVADRGYSSGEVYLGLDERGIEAYIPPLDHSVRRQGYFGQEDFRHDAETDSYICPQGARLQRQGAAQELRYRASKQDCLACPVRALCTSGQRRSLKISPYEGYLQAAREKQRSRRGRRASRLRSVCSERTFAEAKGAHGLGRARQRGRPNVSIQALLTATVINLKRYLRAQTRVFPQTATARTCLMTSLTPRRTLKWRPTGAF
jgi:transposase